MSLPLTPQTCLQWSHSDLLTFQSDNWNTFLKPDTSLNPADLTVKDNHSHLDIDLLLSSLNGKLGIIWTVSHTLQAHSISLSMFIHIQRQKLNAKSALFNNLPHCAIFLPYSLKWHQMCLSIKWPSLIIEKLVEGWTEVLT